MIRRRRSPASARIVFVGRRCDLSAIPLQGIIQSSIDVGACLIPARRLPGQPAEPVRLVPPTKLRRLPLLAVAPTTSIDQFTSEQQIPLYEISDTRSERLLDLLSELAPDLIVVSCFPWRIPAQILEIPRFGTINVHPSLLPRHRGPDPLFWTFQQGEANTGASIHVMNDALDAGPLIAQSTLSLIEPIEGGRVEQRLARMAGSILPDIVRGLTAGTIESTPQDNYRASYEGWPKDDDLVMSPDWTIERVLRFVTGVVSLGYLPTVEIDGEMREVESAVTEGEPSAETTAPELFTRVDFVDGAALLRISNDSNDEWS